MARSGGRAATKGVIEGSIALSVGRPSLPEPEGWRWTELGTVARLESGHTPSRRHPEWWGGDIPWIGIKDATGNHGREVSETAENTNEDGIANSAARVLPKDTVCVSRTASVGYVIMMGRPMATSQDFANWVCSDKINPHFLKYVFLLENAALKRFSYGTTHQTIYYPELKAFHVCMPDRAEQDRIVAVLKSLDDKIELNRQMSATLEEMARALYRSWFVDFDPIRALELGQAPAFMDDATAAMFPDRFGEDGLPEGWRQGKLADLVSLNPTETLKKNAPAPYLEMRGIPTSGMNADAPVSREYTSGMKFRDRDTLLARITPSLENGKTAIAQLSSDEVGWGSTEFIVMRPICGGVALPYCIARDEDFRTYAIQAMTGSSGRQRVDHTSIARYSMPIPPEAVLNRFETLATPWFERARDAGLESRTLAILRDTLLPKLMSGEIRLRDAEAQVEEAL